MGASTTPKYEQWSISFVCLICSLIGGTFLWGGIISYQSGILVFLGFIAFILLNLYMAFYTVCRHCCYYGKRCYTALGLLVPFFFKRVFRPGSVFKEGLWLSLFVLNILYPLVFLFLQNQLSGRTVFHAAAYLISPAVVVLLVGRFACPKCRNKKCAVNPDRKSVC